MIQLLSLQIVFTLASAAWARDVFNGQDVSPVAKYFAHYVRAVRKPFLAFHWRNDPKLVASEEAQTDPRKFGRQVVEVEGPSFLAGLYSPHRTSYVRYGGGLYAAFDPVSSETYGGRDRAGWALLQMRIPVGFNLLDLRAPIMDLTDAETGQFQRTLATFNCPSYEAENFPGGHPFLNYVEHVFRSNALSSLCADLVSHVVANLDIDGFVFSYGAEPYETCQSSTNRDLALVLTSSSWLRKQGADAQLFTAGTRASPQDRRRIDGAFLSLHYLKWHHWDDVADAPAFEDETAWLRENLFECAGTDSLAAPR